MFDNVQFTGDISLGAVSIALTQLILAIALYLRQVVIERQQEQKRRELEYKHQQELTDAKAKNTSQ